jgi:hypothetical protein
LLQLLLFLCQHFSPFPFLFLAELMHPFPLMQLLLFLFLLQ